MDKNLTDVLEALLEAASLLTFAYGVYTILSVLS